MPREGQIQSTHSISYSGVGKVFAVLREGERGQADGNICDLEEDVDASWGLSVLP